MVVDGRFSRVLSQARLQTMQMELDLPEDIVRDLLSIAGTDIVVIADDSSSMNQVPRKRRATWRGERAGHSAR